MKTALITGIGGQDGRYLAELLHAKDYRVFGLIHGQDAAREARIQRILPFVKTIIGDLADLSSLIAAIDVAAPDEIYNLGALSSVAQSWAQPELTAEITGLGALRLLEAIRLTGRFDRTKFYQASSSEMFGKASLSPQNEDTPFSPVHPYAVAKVFAHQTTVTYREAHGLFACCGILFNHESPRRGRQFVARKITRGVARISLGKQPSLSLGDLSIRRDWGYAPEYADAMWRMLQQPDPAEFVIATGTSRTLKEFVALAFAHVGIVDWEEFVTHDPALTRPNEIHDLRGDATRAGKELGWSADTMLDDIVAIMVDADLEREERAPA